MTSWSSSVDCHSNLSAVRFKLKLKHLKHNVKDWRHTINTTKTSEALDIRSRIDEIDLRAETSLLKAADVNRRINLVKALADLEHHKLNDLKQKSKIKWALEGDVNSNFFHGIINNRRNRSRINETNPTRPSFSSNLFKQLTSEDNLFLESPFTSREIKDVVWDSGGNKAPSPDGFTFKLIKKHWSILGNDITSYVKDFYTSAFIPRGCNSSFITLIPKVDDPITVSDFRPISLIRRQYKIIAKVLANRLALVIPSVVSEVQMAFIKGCQITDGPLLVNEIISWAKKHKKKLLLLKVDFEKAFDSLSWSFLESIMLQMGFGAKWRKWMHSCLNSAYALILINGSPTNEFKMEKGLRQGDPLFPFLFILAVEALNVVFLEARNKSIFLGAEVGKDKVPISHLQFVDDALIVGQWSLPNARNLSRILTCFHLVSGLKVNFNKSKLFGIRVSSSELNSIACSIGCQPSQLPCTYLGLPIGANMSRTTNWSTLSHVQLVINPPNFRVLAWVYQLTLSYGGRLTLIKSVLGSLGVYFFSLFKSPVSIIKKLESIRRNFFWGGNSEEKKIAWVTWDKVIGPRDQ
ncbi:putative RNA-directed DNA polymerase [Tanacetum coccineum]